MNEVYTPKQIAKMLNISTTTLRRYEEQGLIPDVHRTASNRRCYLPVHLQAFTVIRTLLQGYDIPVVYEVMRNIKKGNTVEAFWLINRQLHALQEEKQRVAEILTMIRNTDFSKYRNIKVAEAMKIGEVAALAGVNPSAIRHWEKEGLIKSERDRENGYRMYTVSELKKIIVISSLRKTIYYIENMKQLLNELETQHYTKVERSFQLALQKLNHQLATRFQGIAELMKYVTLYREQTSFRQT
ncbi:MerR family DNA-binding transcriptional regulator [Paenibacillus sp. FSL R5-0527]|uniref:MerR family DNA-binding transcriptional regulator n=1 Tax=Paenibacillus TaxID=44249 RepID=UPI00097A3A19|nr:MerR family DNA-binding transcriptional regulator [Paenibacillus macerans]MED4953410.1 MerR family DNA-binding transcriptional regulator [Paenibacillus macerans]OMG50217.1 MerR family transcriptional regulator [Paenibacillus macerans]